MNDETPPDIDSTSCNNQPVVGVEIQEASSNKRKERDGTRTKRQRLVQGAIFALKASQVFGEVEWCVEMVQG
jgi:hypothetical protein